MPIHDSREIQLHSLSFLPYLASLSALTEKIEERKTLRDPPHSRVPHSRVRARGPEGQRARGPVERRDGDGSGQDLTDG